MPLQIDNWLFDPDLIRYELGSVGIMNHYRAIGSSLIRSNGAIEDGDATTTMCHSIGGPNIAVGTQSLPCFLVFEGLHSVSDDPKIFGYASVKRLTEQHGFFGFFDDSGTINTALYAATPAYAASGLWGFEYASSINPNVWTLVGWSGGAIKRTATSVAPSIYPLFDSLELRVSTSAVQYLINGVSVYLDNTDPPSNLAMRWCQGTVADAGWASYPGFYMAGISLEWNRT